MQDAYDAELAELPASPTGDEREGGPARAPQTVAR
jgi:hypothetical protein